MLRLSELLGALTYLQNLVRQQGRPGLARQDDGADERRDAKRDAQGTRLAGAYNRGFKGYELSYRQCTPNAQAIISRFLDESAKIARDVDAPLRDIVAGAHSAARNRTASPCPGVTISPSHITRWPRTMRADRPARDRHAS